jgi:uncharacterized protein (TIGR04222 family)
MLSSTLYLLLYSVALIAVFKVCRFAVSEADRTDKLPALPIPAQIDPYALAYLRDGKNAVERLAILELLDGGYLCLRRQEASFWRSRPARMVVEKIREGQDLPWHLSAALSHFSKPRGAEEISDLWHKQWSRLEKELAEQLNGDQLLAPQGAEFTSWVAGAISFIAFTILSVPILSVVSGLFSNALGLFLFASVCFVGTACDLGRLSKRGKAYLAQLQQAFREKPATVWFPAVATAGASFTLTFEFAMFGSESLKDTPYESFNAAFDSGDSGDGGDGGGDD